MPRRDHGQRPVVREATEPITPRGLSIDIVAPAGGETLFLQLLDDRAVRYWVHWTGSRTQPCVEPKTDCEWCQKGKPAEQQGYVGAVDLVRKRRVCVRLTEFALRRAEWLATPQTSLRGKVITYYRAPQKSANGEDRDRGRCVLGLREDYRAMGDNLPQPFSILDLLWQNWDADDKPRRARVVGPAVFPPGGGPPY